MRRVRSGQRSARKTEDVAKRFGFAFTRRLHSSLGYLSPTKYEEEFAANNDRALSTGLPTGGVCVACATPPVDNPAPAKA